MIIKSLYPPDVRRSLACVDDGNAWAAISVGAATDDKPRAIKLV